MRKKRVFTRIDFIKEMEIRTAHGDHTYAQVCNICLRGGFIILSKEQCLYVGERFQFLIVLSYDEYKSIKGEAKVVWHDNEMGYGIIFVEMDSESFTDLKRLIEVNVKHKDGIQKEIAHVIKKIE